MRQIQQLSEIASWISESSWQSVALSSAFNQKAAENLVLKLQLMQHTVKSELDDTYLPTLLAQYRFKEFKAEIYFLGLDCNPRRQDCSQKSRLS